MSKKVYLKSWGCQMNNRDSEHVIAQFLAGGYCLTDNKQDADVILLNTCSVRQHAEDKVWSELGRLKKLKGHQVTRSPGYQIPVIGVIGCMAENLKDGIIERMPHVDLVCGPNDLARVYQLVEKVKKTQKNILAVGSATRNPSFYKHLYQADKKHSYVVIMEGCNNFCSYCVVPYVRGSERSRPYKNVLIEVSQLVAKGISSVTLLGQNVNSYNGGCNFPELLKKVSTIAGLSEISFATSHPKDASRELFEAMRDCKNVRKHLHLPIQTGSNRILRLMNRGYTREHYLKLVDSYRAVAGESAMLGTDMIVGFPTETDKDFKDTVGVLKKVKFNFAYLFKYSPRLRTKAARLADSVPQETKEKRHRILLDLQKRISAEKKDVTRSPDNRAGDVVHWCRGDQNRNFMKKKIIFIVGPTATGKSKAAIKLATKINGEIISCDSMQIYKGLDILSAKPSQRERKRIKHHLMDIISPSQFFDVNKFVRLSTTIIEDIHERGKVPILVGGTGLYIDSLLNGLFQGPAKDAVIRSTLQKQAEQYGCDYLHQQLERIDPEAAHKIHPHDVRRIMRALEVYAITGQPISVLQKQRRGLLQDARYTIRVFGFALPRPQLYEHINKRVETMFEKGAVAEVRKVLRKRTSLTFRQALGIKEIAVYLRGEMSLEGAKELMKKNTRHFAKRQLTWFRKNNNIKWIKSSNSIVI